IPAGSTGKLCEIRFTVRGHDQNGTVDTFGNDLFGHPAIAFAVTSVLRGDANGDGNITVLDVLMVLDFIWGRSTPTPAQDQAADMNGDGNVTVLDVLATLDVIWGRDPVTVMDSVSLEGSITISGGTSLDAGGMLINLSEGSYGTGLLETISYTFKGSPKQSPQVHLEDITGAAGDIVELRLMLDATPRELKSFFLKLEYPAAALEFITDSGPSTQTVKAGLSEDFFLAEAQRVGDGLEIAFAHSTSLAIPGIPAGSQGLLCTIRFRLLGSGAGRGHTFGGDLAGTAESAFSATLQDDDLPVLTMAQVGQGTITPAAGTHAVEAQTPQAITAQPANGWRFVRWTATGGATVADANLADTTTTLTDDGAVTAVFEELPSEIRLCRRTAGGSLNGQVVDSTHDSVTVYAGAALIGSVSVETVNGMSPNAVAPLAATLTWGDRTANYWTPNPWIDTGTNTYAVPVDAVAPSQPGDYYLIIGFSGSYDAAQVLSLTHPGRTPVWNDGNDAGFDWTGPQMQQALGNGGEVAVDMLLMDDTFGIQQHAFTAVKVVVSAHHQITNGSPVDSAIDPAGDVDWFTFTVGAGGATNVRIQTNGPSGDTQMWLYGPNSQTRVMAYNDDANGLFSVITLPSLARGTYYIRVGEYGNNGTIPAYTLTARWDVPALPARYVGTLYEHDGGAVRGTVQVDVAKTGRLQAKVVRPAKTTSLRLPGWSRVDAEGMLHATMIDGRSGAVLTLDIDPETWIGTGSFEVMENGAQRGFDVVIGGVNWHRTLRPANEFMGYYTVGVAVAEDLGKGEAGAKRGELGYVPSGSGYLALNVSNTGQATYSGKAGDGTRFSGTTTVVEGPAGGGYITVFAPLYSRLGHVAGRLFIQPRGHRPTFDGEDFIPCPVSSCGIADYNDVEAPLSRGWDVFEWSFPGTNPGRGQDADAFLISLSANGVEYPKGATLEDLGFDAVGFTLLDDLGGLDGILGNASAYRQGKQTEYAYPVEDAMLFGMEILADQGKLVAPAATKPTRLRDGQYEYHGDTDAGLKISYAAQTGVFKGSFKLYYDYLTTRWQHKTVTVSFEGILTPLWGGMGVCTQLPLGQGYFVLQDDSPEAGYRRKRSCRVWLESDAMW
ncbi:MAG: hypothetical protein GX595_21075, partial [Lentisphaerae bacterium]|nr:hypothetical protein [Lentisphaerota bacterium]